MYRNMRLVIVTLLIAVSLSIPATASIKPAAAQGVSPAISIVTLTTASAGVRRLGWSAFTRLVLGAQVNFGDLIDPKGKTVRVLCSNLVEMTIVKLGPIPCPRDRTILVQDTQELAGWQRGKPEDVTIPFLISPRGSEVATTTPTIWWNAVDGVDGYRVTVRGDTLNWTKEIDDPKVNQIIYPKTAPALQPGQTYTAEIVAIVNGADGPSSADEDVPGLSFTLMPPDQVATIQKAASQIKANVSDRNMAALSTALYYSQNGLKAEAVQLLVGITGDPLLQAEKSAATSAAPTPSVITLSASPAVYLAQGDLFMQSHSGIYAAAAYSRALDLATRSGDQDSEANALVGLARLATDPQQQSDYATQALQLWQQLGAKTQIESVQKEFNLTGS